MSKTGTDDYRYAFNGKENDGEAKGEGNQQYYGMRVYDPRLGRFLSVDPITSQYPELTPSQFASNTPIFAIDLDGLEDTPSTYVKKPPVINVPTTLSITKPAFAKALQRFCWEDPKRTMELRKRIQ